MDFVCFVWHPLNLSMAAGMSMAGGGYFLEHEQSIISGYATGEMMLSPPATINCQ